MLGDYCFSLWKGFQRFKFVGMRVQLSGRALAQCVQIPGSNLQNYQLQMCILEDIEGYMDKLFLLA